MWECFWWEWFFLSRRHEWIFKSVYLEYTRVNLVLRSLDWQKDQFGRQIQGILDHPMDTALSQIQLWTSFWPFSIGRLLTGKPGKQMKVTSGRQDNKDFPKSEYNFEIGSFDLEEKGTLQKLQQYRRKSESKGMWYMGKPEIEDRQGAYGLESLKVLCTVMTERKAWVFRSTNMEYTRLSEICIGVHWLAKWLIWNANVRHNGPRKITFIICTPFDPFPNQIPQLANQINMLVLQSVHLKEKLMYLCALKIGLLKIRFILGNPKWLLFKCISLSRNLIKTSCKYKALLWRMMT